MGTSNLRRLTLCVTLVAGSQLGHAASYFVRYGVTAASEESAGLHAYYPALSGTLSAMVGGALMACMVILAASRIVRGASPGRRPRRSVKIGDVLPALFTAQLLLFLGQETLECLVGGRTIPSPMEELLWGIFGQLPAALLASIVVSWLSARMHDAWVVLVSCSARLVRSGLTLLPARQQRPAPPASPALASTFPRAFRKRGPPNLLPAPVL